MLPSLVRHKATPTQLFIAEYLLTYAIGRQMIQIMANLIASNGRCICGQCETD